MRTGPIGVTNGYFPGNVQITNANIVNANIFGDAADGGSDPGPPGPISAVPAGTDTMMLNEGTQVGTPAFNKRFTVYGPVLLAGAITFLKGAADVITIDGRTTPHTSLTDFVENFTRGAGSAAGRQRAVEFNVLTGGQLTVNTNAVEGLRVDLAGAAGDLAPGGGATRPNITGIRVISSEVPDGGFARRCGLLIDRTTDAGVAGVLPDPAVGFHPDNLMDIGLTAANAIGGDRLRPRSIYAGTSVVVGASTTITTDTVQISVAGTVEALDGALTVRSRRTIADTNGSDLNLNSGAGAVGGVASRSGGNTPITAGNAGAGVAGGAAGGTVSLQAGTGAAAAGSTGAGGQVTISAGVAAAGAGTSQAGAPVTLTAGAAVDNGGLGAIGGNITLTSGIGIIAGRGGDLIFTSGAGAGGQRRGVFRPGADTEGSLGVNEAGGFRWLDAVLSNQVRIFAGLADANARAVLSVGDATGGELLLGRGGATVIDARVKGNGAAGSLLIDANGVATPTIVQVATTGQAGTIESLDAGTLTVQTRRAADGAGSNMTVSAAAGRATAGAVVFAGGALDLNAGNAAVFGVAGAGAAGGAVTIDAGNGAAEGAFGGAGGALTLTAGIGARQGAGGAVSLVAGAGGILAGGNGGAVNITAGAAGAGSGGTGGDLTFTSGAGDGAGRRGVFRPGVDNQDDIGLAGAAGFRWRDIHITRDIAWGAAGAAVDIGVTRGGANNLLIYRGSGIGAGAVTVQVATTGQAGTVESVDATLFVRSRRVAAGAGNALALRGGISADAGGGGISAIAGDAGGAAATGGPVTLTAGTGAGTGAGGAFAINAGAAGATGSGGAINITGADAIGGAGAGTTIALQAGGSFGATAGGAITITSGIGGGTGAGGAVSITAGAGGIGAGGNGGSVTITAGAAGVGSAGQGGDINVTLGLGNGAGRSGQVNITRNNAGVAADVPIVQIIQDQAVGLAACLLLRQDDTDVASFRVRNGANGADLLTHIEADPQGHVLRFTTLAPIIEAVDVAMTLRSRVTAGAGVNLNLTAGPATAGAGGIVNIDAGAGVGAAAGGEVTIDAGAGGVGGGGGGVTVTAGNAGAGVGTGGTITLQAGTVAAGGDGAGGAIDITAGSAVRTAAGPFTGGVVSITAGDGAGAAASAAPGGALTLTAGNGGAGTAGNGGDILIQPGDLAGAGVNGVVRLRNAAGNRTPDLLPRTNNEGRIGNPTARWTRIPEAWHHHLEDFEGGSALADFTRYQQSVGSTTAPTIVANGLGGLVEVQPADAINNTSGIIQRTNNYNPTQRSVVFECIVQPTTAVTTVRISVGLSDQALNPDGGGNGIFARYDSGLDAAWTLVGRGGAGAGAVAGVTAPVNGTRQRLTIELFTTDNIARLYVNGVLEATSAANPAGNAAMAVIGFVQQLAVAPAQRNARFDKFEVWQDNGL